MNVRRSLVATALIGGLLTSCSDSRISGGNTSSSVATTTTTAPTPTTQPPPLTTSPSTTVVASTSSTTSTIAAVRGLDLSADGLGEESFGAESTGVIAYVESILGSPTDDTGWFNPADTGAACLGSEIRYVTWSDLSLFFTDTSTVASGLRHFAAYSYGPAAGPFIVPFGLSTDGGVSVGITVDQLLAIDPSALIATDEQSAAAYFQIADGLSGFLTGTTGNDIITSFVGGFGCGE